MKSRPLPIAIAVVLDRGRVLIGPRPPGKPLAGRWEFPGGKILPGESPSASATRECLEETGLEVFVVAEFPEVIHEYEYGSVHLHFFSCLPLPPESLGREPLAPPLSSDLVPKDATSHKAMPNDLAPRDLANNLKLKPREPFRWVAVDSLGAYAFPEGNAAVLSILRNRTDSRSE